MKVAVLDLGTNVFNLLLASFTLSGCEYIKEFKCAARLGAGGLSSGRIAPEAFGTASDALGKIMDAIKESGGADVILPYATSAVRDAGNGGEFVETMNGKFGISIRVIPGEREAEFIFKGIMESIPSCLKESGENILMLDIGGGSNEFIISDGTGILWKRSFPIGMARMRERFSYQEPIDSNTIEEFTHFCSEVLEPLWEAVGRYSPKIFVGSSGSFDTFRDLLFNCPRPEPASMEIPAQLLKELDRKLVASNSHERLAMPGMSQIRVDYIVLASLFTQLVIERVSPRVIYQSSYSLKEGAMAEYYASWRKNKE